MYRFGFLIVVWIGLYPTIAFSNDRDCAVGDFVQGQLKKSTSRVAGEFTLGESDQVYMLGGLASLAEPFDTIKPGASLTLYSKDGAPDRYGRLTVQAFVDLQWLQGDLLRRGNALSSGLGVGSECQKRMLLAERQAEAAKLGIWGNDPNPNLGADDLESLAEKFGYFVLVKGKVLSVGDRSRRLYLNFGQKWSQDFTVSVVKKGSGAFKGDVARLASLKNKTVRVRGILEERQGPLIRLVDEAQIEILE